LEQFHCSPLNSAEAEPKQRGTGCFFGPNLHLISAQSGDEYGLTRYLKVQIFKTLQESETQTQDVKKKGG
jgi:hypothetical protein